MFGQLARKLEMRSVALNSDHVVPVTYNHNKTFPNLDDSKIMSIYYLSHFLMGQDLGSSLGVGSHLGSLMSFRGASWGRRHRKA